MANFSCNRMSPNFNAYSLEVKYTISERGVRYPALVEGKYTNYPYLSVALQVRKQAKIFES